ncbi:hypothetical protein BH10ACI1_BH10ACI1_05340 [soil metagenome]
MTEKDISKSASAPDFGTAEEEQNKIKEDKAALGKLQEETSENRANSEEAAEHSTSVNAAHEEPVDPKMPNMPPA